MCSQFLHLASETSPFGSQTSRASCLLSPRRPTGMSVQKTSNFNKHLKIAMPNNCCFVGLLKPTYKHNNKMVSN